MDSSPRISFSHDLYLSDVMPIQQQLSLPLDSSGLSSSIDFNFCISENFHQEPSSADELFVDGKLLPIKIKEKNFSNKQMYHSVPVPPLLVLHDDHATSIESLNKDNSEETKISTSHKEANEKQRSRRFKLCSSMNFTTVCKHALCLLPLFLRSNSTGTTANVKPVPVVQKGHHHKQYWQKTSLVSTIKPSPSPSSIGYQNPPLKKGCGSYGNGLGVGPILNFKLGHHFCLGSIIFSGKYKNKRM